MAPPPVGGAEPGHERCARIPRWAPALQPRKAPTLGPPRPLGTCAGSPAAGRLLSPPPLRCVLGASRVHVQLCTVRPRTHCWLGPTLQSSFLARPGRPCALAEGSTSAGSVATPPRPCSWAGPSAAQRGSLLALPLAGAGRPNTRETTGRVGRDSPKSSRCCMSLGTSCGPTKAGGLGFPSGTASGTPLRAPGWGRGLRVLFPDPTATTPEAGSVSFGSGRREG